MSEWLERKEIVKEITLSINRNYPNKEITELHIKQAIASCPIIPGSNERHVETIYEMAKAIKEAEDERFIPRLSEIENDNRKSVQIFAGDNEKIYSKILVEKLAFEVKRIREDIFNKSEPPFESQETAISWIKETAKKEVDDRVVELVVDKKTSDQIHDQWGLEDAPVMIRAIGIRKINLSRLSIPGPDGYDDSVSISSYTQWPHAYPPSILARLKKSVEKLSSLTGWQEAQSLMHILTGVSPLLPPAQIEANIRKFETEDGSFFSQHGTIKFYGTDMSRDQLIKLHGQLRILLGVKHKRPMNREQMELIEFIREMSETLNCKNAPEFWRQVTKEWSKRKGKSLIESQSFQKRYKRACDKNGIQPYRFKKNIK